MCTGVSFAEVFLASLMYESDMTLEYAHRSRSRTLQMFFCIHKSDELSQMNKLSARHCVCSFLCGPDAFVNITLHYLRHIMPHCDLSYRSKDIFSILLWSERDHKTQQQTIKKTIVRWRGCATCCFHMMTWSFSLKGLLPRLLSLCVPSLPPPLAPQVGSTNMWPSGGKERNQGCGLSGSFTSCLFMRPLALCVVFTRWNRWSFGSKMWLAWPIKNCLALKTPWLPRMLWIKGALCKIVESYSQDIKYLGFLGRQVLTCWVGGQPALLTQRISIWQPETQHLTNCSFTGPHVFSYSYSKVFLFMRRCDAGFDRHHDSKIGCLLGSVWQVSFAKMSSSYQSKEPDTVDLQFMLSERFAVSVLRRHPWTTHKISVSLRLFSSFCKTLNEIC